MIQRAVERAVERVRADARGRVATYIPELAGVDPRGCGVAVATVSGELYEAGDVRHEFTIQSISKVLTYGWALSQLGRDEVDERVGVEPSGDPFNAIVLDDDSGRPFNPMVNAGAIAVTALLLERGLVGEPQDFCRIFGAAAGRELTLDERVFESERATGHRNRAIAYLMFGAGMIGGDVEAALDLYFAQCSVRVDARDLAVIAATLANHGMNPFTGEEIFSGDSIQDVLSVMFTCGMYDSAGEWLRDVGVPAKSGVGGGLIGVANRQLGLAAYSPLLDRFGTSVRGAGAFRELSREFGLHVFCRENHASNLLQAAAANPVSDRQLD